MGVDVKGKLWHYPGTFLFLVECLYGVWCSGCPSCLGNCDFANPQGKGRVCNTRGETACDVLYCRCFVSAFAWLSRKLLGGAASDFSRLLFSEVSSREPYCRGAISFSGAFFGDFVIFSFHEGDYYRFGVEAGVRNLLKNGFALGLRKTIGKISQPINSYTRFPEYCYMDQAISHYVAESRRSKPLRILDVGSPKCFGLYLANKLNIEVVLTDVSPLNLDEYQLMSKRLETKAKGHVHFATQDARSLDYEDAAFDIVYSMSVIEHV